MAAPSAGNAAILHLLAEGYTYGEVARELRVTRGVVAGVNYRSAHPYVRTGRGPRVRGGKLCIEQARDIRARRLAGEKLEALAAEFGIDQSMVSLIARGIRWPEAA